MKMNKIALITALITGLFCLCFLLSACCKTKYVYVVKHSLAEYGNSDYNKLREFIEEEPIVKDVVIVDYYSFLLWNHWIVTEDRLGQIYFISQPGHNFFYAEYGRKESIISIGDSIRVSLYRYQKHPDYFSPLRLDGHAGGIGDYIIKTNNGWVDNVYYCPDITIVNETIYKVESYGDNPIFSGEEE
jgi:hypothetical protein